jgi:hypothetical protein
MNHTTLALVAVLAAAIGFYGFVATQSEQHSLTPATPLHNPLLIRPMLLAAMAEMQVLAKAFVNKQHSLVHLEVQATRSSTVPKLSLDVLIDYQLHVKS